MDTHTRIMRPRERPDNTPCPLFMTAVPAGFPSRADDYIDGELAVKRLWISGEKFALVPDNGIQPSFPAIHDAVGGAAGCCNKPEK